MSSGALSVKEPDMSDILMVVPRYVPLKRQSYYEFPLGMAYVSSCLDRAGHSVTVINLNQGGEECYERLAKVAASLQPKLVLTGGLSAHYQQIRCLVSVVRESSPESLVVVGGGIVTASPKLMFDFLNPDFIILGEGELTAVELADQLLGRIPIELNAVDGIGYRKEDGTFFLTNTRPPIMNLDSLPFPDLEGFGIEEYLSLQQPNDNLYLYISDHPRFYPIISSRGCPYDCTFCYHPLGQKYRSRSVDNFMSEIEYVISKHDVRNVAIFDELISCDRDRLFEICRRMKKLSHPVRWMCQLRVDFIDEEMLQVMKDAGCFIVSYGFESASNEVLQSMKKSISKEQISRALQLSRTSGIGVQGYFIFGDPAETLESARETIAFWKSHADYHITLGFVRPYPGSELWENEFKKCGLDELSFLEKCVSDPPNMSRLSQKDWFSLQKEVQGALMDNDNFGEFISGYEQDNGAESMTIRCPHCNRIVEYGNFNQRILGVFKLTCRLCNQAMNMTPLAFEHVRRDYLRNFRAFNWMKKGRVPVYVIPCMNEAEFEAQRERLLEGLLIAGFLDADKRKQGRLYQGLPVLDTGKEVINKLALEGYGFIIPLTRYADKLYGDLIASGVSADRICRLDVLQVGFGTETLTERLLAGEVF